MLRGIVLLQEEREAFSRETNQGLVQQNKVIGVTGDDVVQKEMQCNAGKKRR